MMKNGGCQDEKCGVFTGYTDVSHNYWIETRNWMTAAVHGRSNI
jgi:hypothetical protein